MRKNMMHRGWCAVLVCCSIGQPALAKAPTRTVATRSFAISGQASEAPKTAAEFSKFLQTLNGQLTSWKQQIESIPFDSLNINSKERGILDNERTWSFKYIANVQEDIENIRSQHSLSNGIWLLSDLYELRENVESLNEELGNLLSARDVGSTEAGIALAKQNLSLYQQINGVIEMTLPYLSQKAAKTEI